jgi:nitrogen regulatory protein PII-like uncharacterized protein
MQHDPHLNPTLINNIQTLEDVQETYFPDMPLEMLAKMMPGRPRRQQKVNPIPQDLLDQIPPMRAVDGLIPTPKPEDRSFWNVPKQDNEMTQPESKRSPEGGSLQYLALLDKMRDLHIRKNAGYAGDSPDPWANFRESEDFDVSSFKGILVRMSDKWIRIKNLVKNPANEKVGESIKDTLMDLSAYALIAIAILEEEEAE